MRRLLFSLSLVAPLCCGGQLFINELGIAPAPGHPDFVELYNRSNCPVDLSCYTLVYSGTSGGNNPTGWTVKFPAGSSIAACGYFVIGGLAGSGGISGGTGYPTGGAVVSYPQANLNLGTLAITANAVFMRQGLTAGTLTNNSGQLTLLDAGGTVVASVSYNRGNNAGSYPLSAYTTCAGAGNVQGVDNIPNPGNATFNRDGTFTAAGTRGIFLDATGSYLLTSNPTPGAANPSQMGCAPGIELTTTSLNSCISGTAQTLALPYHHTTGSPTHYSINWNASPPNDFLPVANATLPAAAVPINVPANTLPGIYTGQLTVSNRYGPDCRPVRFTVQVYALPVVDAGSYPVQCGLEGSVQLTGSPAGGLFSGPSVTDGRFSPPGFGHFPVQYTYTETSTGCTGTASTTITVVPAPATPSVIVRPPACGSLVGELEIRSPLGPDYLYTVDHAPFSAQVIYPNLPPGLHRVQVLSKDGCRAETNVEMAPPPLVPSAPVVSLTQPGCLQREGTITITAINAGESYSINGLNYDNTSGIFTGLAPGVYSVTTKSREGCISAPSIVTIQWAPPLPVVAVNSPVVCPNQTATIAATVSTSGTYHYVWTVPAGVANPGDTAQFSADIAGNYTVTITNGDGCQSKATGTLSFSNAAPVVADGKQVCSGSRVLLSGQPAGGVWSGPGVDGQWFDAGTLPPGDYGVQYTVRSGTCGGTASAVVTVIAVPAPPSLSVQNSCDGTTTLTATNVQGDLLWSNGATTAVIRVGAEGRYTAVQTVGGCASAAAVVSAKPSLPPARPGITAQQPDCTRPLGSLVITAPVGDGLAYSVNGQPYQAAPNFPDLGPGVYEVTVKNDAGCISAPSVVVFNQPSGLVQVDRKVCLPPGQPYLFNGSMLAASGTYTAMFPSLSGCDSLVKLTLTIASEQRIALSACGAVHYSGKSYASDATLTTVLASQVTGCDSVLQTVVIRILPLPQLRLPADKTICRGDSVVLFAEADSAQIIWVGMRPGNPLVHTPHTTTTYTAIATNRWGCADTAQTTVRIDSFQLQLQATPNPVLAGRMVSVQSLGSSAYSVERWQPPFLHQRSKTQQFIADTTTQLVVEALSASGCRTTASLLLTVDPLNGIYIPDAFTPNGDGRNDLFSVAGGRFTRFNLTVYNRWGEVVFIAREATAGWDGTRKGVPQPAGVYVYLLQAELTNGRVVQQRGTVTLLR